MSDPNTLNREKTTRWGLIFIVSNAFILGLSIFLFLKTYKSSEIPITELLGKPIGQNYRENLALFNYKNKTVFLQIINKKSKALISVLVENVPEGKSIIKDLRNITKIDFLEDIKNYQAFSKIGDNRDKLSYDFLIAQFDPRRTNLVSKTILNSEFTNVHVLELNEKDKNNFLVTQIIRDNLKNKNKFNYAKQRLTICLAFATKKPNKALLDQLFVDFPKFFFL
jgi:hypothetical protein